MPVAVLQQDEDELEQPDVEGREGEREVRGRREKRDGKQGEEGGE